MPTRTTSDYEGPTVSASIQAVLDKAVQDEEEMTIDATYVIVLCIYVCMYACTVYG